MSIRRILLMICVPAFTSCAGEEGNDYCDNHQLVHADHLANVANLRIDYRQNGELEALLSAPLTSLTSAALDNSSVVQKLMAADRVFQIESELGCEPGSSDVNMQKQQIAARFLMRCGSNNKFGKVNVVLFDTFPELQEVEARVSTPAAKKNFIINRRCPQAMFLTVSESEDRI